MCRLPSCAETLCHFPGPSWAGACAVSCAILFSALRSAPGQAVWTATFPERCTVGEVRILVVILLDFVACPRSKPPLAVVFSSAVPWSGRGCVCTGFLFVLESGLGILSDVALLLVALLSRRAASCSSASGILWSFSSAGSWKARLWAARASSHFQLFVFRKHAVP